MMERVLVTGAAGFLGFALATAIRQRFPSCELWLADDFSRGERDGPYRDLLAQPGVHEIAGNLSLAETVERLPRGCDHIFHMAALNGTGNFYDRPFDVIRASTMPTLLLLEHCARDATLQHFVYAGSSESYAGAVDVFGYPVPTDESVPLVIGNVTNPRWSYGASKLHGEAACVAAGAQHGTPVTILRFHNAYGPRMGDRHVVPDFYARLLQGVASLYGADNTRSFLYVKDAVDAVLAVVAAGPSGDGTEILNVGGDEEIPMRELARRMLACVGEHDRELEVHPAPAGSVSRRCPDVTRLNARTGFHPAFDLDAGLRRAADWYYHGIDNVSDGGWMLPPR